jgi:hypothetical protein
MEIGGKERPLKFGINQTDLFCELRGIDLQQYYSLLAGFESGNYTFGVIRDLIWSALKDGARQTGEPLEADQFTVGDWMDEDPARYISEALTHLVESMPKASENGSAKKKKTADTK